ncbi:MAG: pyruvate kinase [Actinomycetota bacterium]
MNKFTKIVCTIGPSSTSVEILLKLFKAGMNVARLNFSHGTYADHLIAIKNIRLAAQKSGLNIAIMQDLQGPKIRIGLLPAEGIPVKKGQKLIFDTGTSQYSVNKSGIPIFPVQYKHLHKDLKPKDIVLVEDGLIETQVNSIKGTQITVTASRDCKFKSHKGINLPGVSISIDSITKRDLDFLHFGIDLKVDFIAQSFVRQAEDVRQLMDIIKDRKSSIMVIAKIEKHEAVTNFNSILRQADGIMIARGDLGVEINQEDLPYIQKSIIKKANLAGKPVITATQMLDSMIRNPRPTRAEVSDVANAIIDGSDAVMLSGETASGKYPVEAFEMMLKIINKTENTLDYQEIIQKNFEIQQKTITDAISFASCDIANDLSSKAIITFTQTGNTARHVSKNKPKCMVIGASPNDWVIRQLMMSWGVIPIKTKYTDNINILIDEAVSSAREHGYIKKGDTVVITGGVMINIPGSTNYINVKEVE